MNAPSVADHARLHALDGLRAVASALVVIHHLGAATLGTQLIDKGHRLAGHVISTGTAAGVELFFVLSAVVLARPYLHGAPLRFGRYIARRVQRLMPPYILAWLLAGLSIFLASMAPTWWTETANLPSFSLATWTQQALIFYVGHDHYSFAWWSLTVEVLFYALLPLAVLVLSVFKASQHWRAPLFAIALLIAAWAYATAWTPAGWGGLWPLQKLAVYASCFAGGLVLASGRLGPLFERGALAAGVAVVAASAFLPSVNVHVGWGLLYLALVSKAMDRNAAWSKFLSRDGFVWLGERSYSLFLVHFPVIVLVCHAASLVFDGKTGAYFISTRVLGAALSVWAAMVVFHLAERRFAHGLVTAERFWPWSKAS
jgi:peptidoglycan/LPS O-acetylase OafA/YrhL